MYKNIKNKKSILLIIILVLTVISLVVSKDVSAAFYYKSEIEDVKNGDILFLDLKELNQDLRINQHANDNGGIKSQIIYSVYNDNIDIDNNNDTYGNTIVLIEKQNELMHKLTFESVDIRPLARAGSLELLTVFNNGNQKINTIFINTKNSYSVSRKKIHYLKIF